MMSSVRQRRPPRDAPPAPAPGPAQHGGGARDSAVRVDADALLRERFLEHLGTQVLLGSVAPMVYCVGVVATASASPRLRLHHGGLAVILLWVISAAAVFKCRVRLPPALQLPPARWAQLLFMLESFAECVINVGALNEAVALSADRNCPADTHPAACAATYFWTVHVCLMFKWIITQLPGRQVFFPELIRNALYVAMSLAYVAHLQPEALDGRLLLTLLARGAACTVAAPLLVSLCHDPTFSYAYNHGGAVDDVRSCPAALAPARDALCSACVRFSSYLLPGDTMLEHHGIMGIEAGAVLVHGLNGTLVVTSMTHTANLMTLAHTVLALASKLRAGSTARLRQTQARLGLGPSTAAVHALAWRLAAAGTEAELLRVASEALHGLFPAACAQAVASLDDEGRVAHAEVAAAAEADRRALAGALPRRGEGDGSSVAFVCAAAPALGCVVAHSDDWQPAGAAAFSDWASAAAAGLRAERRLTARLCTHGATVGFLCLAFAAADPGVVTAADTLRAFAETVADALLARRTKDAVERTAREHSRLTSLAKDVFPEHLLHAMSSRHGGGGGSGVVSTPGAADTSGFSGPGDMLTDYHEHVTCIFADVSSWTRLAAALTPEDAMHLLDKLYRRFDDLATAHGVYKVETIGDSYFAVSGMLPKRADHARAALRFALDLHAAAAAVELPPAAAAAAASVGGAAHVQIRVGLHTGPVTSGVIGHLRARFCLFGDTVNVASRMESTGHADAVQLSPAAFDACALPEALMPTRFLDIKGKGHMRVHTVRASSDEEAAVRAALAATPGCTALPGAVSAKQRWRRLAAAVRVAGIARYMDGLGAAAAAARARDDAQLPLPPLPQFGASATAQTALAALTGAARPPSASSISGGSCSGAAATRDQAADALLRSLAVQHMALQQVTTWLPPICFLLYNVVRTPRWLADDVPGAAAVLSVYRPFYVSGCALFAAVHAAFAGRAWLPRRMAARLALRWAEIFTWMQVFLMMHTSVGHLLEIVLVPGGGNCPSASPPQCMRLAFWGIHLPLLPVLWLETQLPLRLVVLPDVARQLLYVVMALFSAHATGGVTAAYATTVLSEAAAAALLTPIVLGLSYQPTQAMTDLLAAVETCPRALHAPRDAICAVAATARRRIFGGVSLVDEHGSALLAVNGFVLVFQLVFSGREVSLLEVASRMGALMGLILAGSAVTKLRSTSSAPSLDALAARLGVAAEQRALRELRDTLASARSEAAMLHAAGEALVQLYPGAVAWAVGTFAEGTGCDLLAALETGPDDAARGALLAALPPSVGAQAGQAAASSSIAVACAAGGASGAVRVLDSRDTPGGLSSHADWLAVAAAGLPTARAVTAPLTAGPRIIGFVTLHFGLYHSREHNWAPLTEFLDAVGGALFVARAFAINRDGAGAVPVRLRPATVRASSANALDGAAVDEPRLYPATAADAAALTALDEAAAADAELLQDWSLDAWKLPDDEVQRLVMATMHAMGLLRHFKLAPAALASFIASVAAHMNDNAFHNFRHVFMVTHASALLVAQSGLRARTLTELDCLALLLSALCHDLEHPGLTNSYHVATRSPLALRYHDSSVLENHHACCGFTLLERSGLLAHLAPAEHAELRKTMVEAVLATDMSVHGYLLARMTARVAALHEAAADAVAASPAGAADAQQGDGLRVRRTSTTTAGAPAPFIAFRRDCLEDRRLLVSYLLHCADLCNPLLPFALSRRIAGELETEFANQAAMERAAGLPVSVMLSPDTPSKARNEIGFIKAVVKPLYRTLADVSPALRACLALIDANCAQWEALIAFAAALMTRHKTPQHTARTATMRTATHSPHTAAA